MLSTHELTDMSWFVGSICQLLVDKGISYANRVSMSWFVGSICQLLVDKGISYANHVSILFHHPKITTALTLSILKLTYSISFHGTSFLPS